MKDALQVGEHNEMKKTVMTHHDQKIQQDQKRENQLFLVTANIFLYLFIYI